MTAFPIEDTYAEAAIKAISNGWLVFVQRRAESTWDFGILAPLTGQELGVVGPNHGRTFDIKDLESVLSALEAARVDCARFEELLPSVQETLRFTVCPTEYAESLTWHQANVTVWGKDLSDVIEAADTRWTRFLAGSKTAARISGRVALSVGTVVAGAYVQHKVQDKVLELLSPKPTVWQRMTGQRPTPYSIIPAISVKSFRIGR